MCDPPGYCTTSPSIPRAVANAVGERLGSRSFVVSRDVTSSSLAVMGAYRRDKKSGIQRRPGTGGCDTRIPGPSHEHGRAVRSPPVCRIEPDSIDRRGVYPSQVTGERNRVN